MTAQADRIKKLIEDPDLTEAFQTVREKYRDLIEETPVANDDALLDIRKMLHLLREVEQTLKQAIQKGHLEDYRTQEQERPGFLSEVKTLWKPK